MGKVRFNAYDLGGHEAARRLWKDYFGSVDGIVYLVDASDATRIAESNKELDGLLSEADLAHTPFVILGNKIDLEGAMSEPQLRDMLGLHQTTGKGTVSVPDNMRPIEVFMVSLMRVFVWCMVLPLTCFPQVLHRQPRRLRTRLQLDVAIHKVEDLLPQFAKAYCLP